MNKIFADSLYWIALINPNDQWYKSTQTIGVSLGEFRIVTTNEIPTETLNYYAECGPKKREAAATLIRSILLDADIEVIYSTDETFLDGLTFYESRKDKGYSLTDCISMLVMQKYRIEQVLTHDEHFA
jgi:predicted nucleic acid-binding protein